MIRVPNQTDIRHLAAPQKQKFLATDKTRMKKYQNELDRLSMIICVIRGPNSNPLQFERKILS